MTIKQFIIEVTVVPTLSIFLWFTVFGTLGINLGPKIAAEAIQVTETNFFIVMIPYHLGSIISIIAVILLCTFFVTSADSSTFGLGMMSFNGNLNPTTKRKLL